MKKIFLIMMTVFYMNIAFAGLEEIFGNAENGDRCQSDYQCQSLCCNQGQGVCKPHDPTGKNPIFCSKEVGEQCLTSQFCKAEYVITCRVVKIGYGPGGEITCALKCPSVETRGSCVNGYCQAPKAPPIPPLNPDCSNAVDP